MDETLLTAAICGSRKGYEKANGVGLDSSDFGEAARVIVQAAREQYDRDPDLASVDYSVLRSQVLRKVGKGSMADSIMDFAATFPTDVSKVNIIEEYRLLRLARCSTELATMLATGQHGEATEKLLAKYKRLEAGDDGSATKTRLTAEDYEDEEGQRIPIMPATLNRYIGGGVLRGHNITVYGRPESGKSMFTINQAAYAVSKGYTVLYVANEEPERDITTRLLARICGCNISSLRDHEKMVAAFLRADERGYSNWNLLHKAGATVKDVRRAAERIRPDLIVIDQLKNLQTGDKGDNRALQLDKIARDVRELGVAYNAVTISVTQAGDSGHHKLGLQMNDIEWSNTGIPGAADLMIGIGIDPEYDAQSKRMLSIQKNKINGRHGMFPVWVVPERTAFLAKPQVIE